MLLALMDEAYTGSTIEDRGTDSGSDDSSAIDVADPVFLDLLKDENDGIAVCQSFILHDGWNMRVLSFTLCFEGYKDISFFCTHSVGVHFHVSLWFIKSFLFLFCIFIRVCCCIITVHK